MNWSRVFTVQGSNAECINGPMSEGVQCGVSKGAPIWQRNGPLICAYFIYYFVSFSTAIHVSYVYGHLTITCDSSMDEANGGSEATEPLSLRLKSILQEIHQGECPHIPNPPGCKRRASVALVIRIRPAFPQDAPFDQEKCSSNVQPFETCLDNFFSQTWVQHGDPEVLFIKRAARVGDRWTSHIAFPGGKREPNDVDDRATSMRETREETGLGLDTDHSLFIGNLPERVITMMWGKTP